jgi:hypothetical protein
MPPVTSMIDMGGLGLIGSQRMTGGRAVYFAFLIRALS